MGINVFVIGLKHGGMASRSVFENEIVLHCVHHLLLYGVTAAQCVFWARSFSWYSLCSWKGGGFRVFVEARDSASPDVGNNMVESIE